MIRVETPYTADFRIKQRRDSYDAGLGPHLVENPSSAPTPPAPPVSLNLEWGTGDGLEWGAGDALTWG